MKKHRVIANNLKKTKWNNKNYFNSPKEGIKRGKREQKSDGANRKQIAR